MMRRVAVVVAVLVFALFVVAYDAGDPESGSTGSRGAFGRLVSQAKKLLGWGDAVVSVAQRDAVVRKDPAQKDPAPEKDAVAQKDSPSSTPQSTSQPGDHERDRMTKFNKAVDALNFASSWVESSFSRYADKVDLERGPTGSETPIITGTSGSNSVLEELRQLLDEKPDTEPLDLLARRFADTGLILIRLLDRARPYYDQQDYKDDGYAKARAMHGPLVTAHRDFQQATAEMRAELRRIGEEARDKEMDKLQAEGRILRYNVMLNLKQARQTIELIRAELRAKKDISKIDPVALKAKNDEMNGSLEVIRHVKETDPAMVVREYRDLGQSNLDQYIWKSEEFLKGTKYVQRAIRDQESISEFEFTFGGGRQGDIIGRFNEMVSVANVLSQ
jgi:hypothetical protein